MAGRVGREQVGEALASGQTFLTFPGAETYLLFKQGFPLREFCAFEVLDDDDAWENLAQGLFRPTVQAAVDGGYGLITDALVWRASPDFLGKLGYAPGELRRINELGVARADEVITAVGGHGDSPVIVSADVGPRGDGYAVTPGATIGAASARDYHTPQISALADTNVALLMAWTMTSATEAAGIAQAAADAGLPIVVSPTVETDGTLPDGTTLSEFVSRVDEATHGYPLFYMVNCAHPTHLDPTLRAARDHDEPWLSRFRGFRANASSKSHEELDSSTELDAGDADDLAARMAAMQAAYDLTVLGGCCGTDDRHIKAIAEACSA